MGLTWGTKGRVSLAAPANRCRAGCGPPGRRLEALPRGGRPWKCPVTEARHLPAPDWHGKSVPLPQQKARLWGFSHRPNGGA